MKLLVVLVVASLLCVVSAFEHCENSQGFQYSCSGRCCPNADSLTDRCCVGLGSIGSSYWYAWVLITFFFLVCVCACIGCGGYGYRRQYVVRHVEHPPPVVVTTATTTSATGYQEFNNQYKGYEAPPPYNSKGTGAY